jgi:hypothetical protein
LRAQGLIAPLPTNTTPESSAAEFAGLGFCETEGNLFNATPGANDPPAHPLTATLSLASQPFQMAVAERLQRDGMLRRVLAFQAGVKIFDPDGNGTLKLIRRYRRWEILNRLM